MAKTFLKMPLRVGIPSDAFLNYAKVYEPLGASQTFLAGAPVVWSSGYIVEGAQTPATAVDAFALKAATSGSAGAYQIPVLPCYHGLNVFANFLGAAGADNTLAAADLGNDFQLYYTATAGPGSTPLWFILDSSSGSEAVVMTSFYSDEQVPNQSETLAVAGDTNARCTFEVKTSVMGWLT